MSYTKMCPYCAEEIKAQAIKCKHCHSNLANTGESKKETKIDRAGRKVGKFGSWWTIFISAPLCPIVGFFFFGMQGFWWGGLVGILFVIGAIADLSKQ